MGQQKYGKAGEDNVIRVPVGTQVVNVDTDEVIGDLTRHGDRLLVARGGKGGLGNMHFKSSVNRTPRQSTPGGDGEQRTLQLELKLLADVGLLGFPNAGKSTLIRAVSAATPKVADYPFTTLYPNLGVVSVEPHRSFVIADIPGLIEGAADGKGIGDRFLGHIERCRVLIHLIDIEGEEPVDALKTVEDELAAYGEGLEDKPRLVALNKLDLVDEELFEAFAAELKEAGVDEVFPISGATGDGIPELLDAVLGYLPEKKTGAPGSAEAEDADDAEWSPI
jgi:GTP-binding protein